MKIASLVCGVHVHDGILRGVCLLGNPPKHAQESATLVVQDTPYNFHKPVEGDNLLIEQGTFLRHGINGARASAVRTLLAPCSSLTIG